MAKLNKWHIAYLEELYDADIDVWFPSTDYRNWEDVNLKPGESKEFQSSTPMTIRITRRGRKVESKRNG